MPDAKLVHGTFAGGIPDVKFGNGPKTLLFFVGGPGNTVPSGLGALGFIRGMRAFTDEYTIILRPESPAFLRATPPETCRTTTQSLSAASSAGMSTL